MLYADDKIINEVNIEWKQLLSEIRKAVALTHSGDYSQPIKPYLRYDNNPQNRIIAMPAYLGGDICMAGMKWIASFPNNINVGLPRAHCIIALNDSTTGVPLAVFNSAKISIMRTASVSGTIIEEYLRTKDKPLKVGIIGWGPIGKCHFRLINEYFANYIEQIAIYDIRSIQDLTDVKPYKKIETIIYNSWEELYKTSDIIITCTVSDSSYIDLEPNANALLLNVSLRDYKPSIYKWVKDSIIVDDWVEVCRENTDIENMHKEWGLSKHHTLDMYDVLFDSKIDTIKSKPIMFNPMGLAVFDIAISHYYYQKLLYLGYGEKL